MYKCERCDNLFEESEIEHRFSRVEGWSHECPNCRSDQIFEVKQCNVCNEWIDVDELEEGGICHQCAKKTLKELNSMILTRFGYAEIVYLRNFVDPEALA